MSGITPSTKKELSGPLDPKHVSTRDQYSGPTLSYIEGWHAIAEANRIFGFDGWDRVIMESTCVVEKERKIGKAKYDGWGVTYTARVRITVRFGSTETIREGCGSGHGIDKDCGLAHESAFKEAETDAMKRALMTLGNKFGLALYDKTQANVRPDDGRMTKTEARPVSVNINSLIDGCYSLDELEDVWGTIDETYIGKLPVDWEQPLKDKYKTKLKDLGG